MENTNKKETSLESKDESVPPTRLYLTIKGGGENLHPTPTRHPSYSIHIETG